MTVPLTLAIGLWPANDYSLHTLGWMSFLQPTMLDIEAFETGDVVLLVANVAVPEQNLKDAMCVLNAKSASIMLEQLDRLQDGGF